MKQSESRQGFPHPPYSRRILAAHASQNPWEYSGTSLDGSCLLIWLLIGADAWPQAKRWNEQGRLCTLLPPDNEDPADINWTPLSGADPVIMHRCGSCLLTGDQIHRLLAAVMRDGVQRIIDSRTREAYAPTHGERQDD